MHTHLPLIYRRKVEHVLKSFRIAAVGGRRDMQEQDGFRLLEMCLIRHAVAWQIFGGPDLIKVGTLAAEDFRTNLGELIKIVFV